MYIAVVFGCLAGLAMLGDVTCQSKQNVDVAVVEVGTGLSKHQLLSEDDESTLAYIHQENPMERRRRKSFCRSKLAGRCTRRRKRCPGRIPDSTSKGKPYCSKFHRCCYKDKCSTANGGCDHICTRNVASYSCSCRKGYELGSDKKTCNKCSTGYELGSDNKTCNDIDECSSDNGNCPHFCSNNMGSHKCLCKSLDGCEYDEDTTNCTCKWIGPLPSPNVWNETVCPLLKAWLFTGGETLTACKEMCSNMVNCTAMHYSAGFDCEMLACPSPIPTPTRSFDTMEGYHLDLGSK